MLARISGCWATATARDSAIFRYCSGVCATKARKTQEMCGLGQASLGTKIGAVVLVNALMNDKVTLHDARGVAASASVMELRSTVLGLD